MQGMERKSNGKAVMRTTEDGEGKNKMYRGCERKRGQRNK